MSTRTSAARFLHAAEGEWQRCHGEQELLRHANSRIQLEVYTQAVGPRKPATQSQFQRMMITSMGRKAGEMDLQKAQKEA